MASTRSGKSNSTGKLEIIFFLFFLQNCKKPTGFTFPPQTKRSYISCFMHLLSLPALSHLGYTGRHQEKEHVVAPCTFPWHWYITIQTEMCLRMCCTHFLCLLQLLILLSCQHKNKSVIEPKNASCQLYIVQMHIPCIYFW